MPRTVKNVEALVVVPAALWQGFQGTATADSQAFLSELIGEVGHGGS